MVMLQYSYELILTMECFLIHNHANIVMVPRPTYRPFGPIHYGDEYKQGHNQSGLREVVMDRWLHDFGALCEICGITWSTS